MQAFIREKQNRGHRETHITEEKEVQNQKERTAFPEKRHKQDWRIAAVLFFHVSGGGI